VKFRQPTHPFLCGKSRRGNFLLKRKTRRDRAVAKLKEVKDELRRRMHLPIPWQGMWLRQVVTGFYGYHAVPTNFSALAAFRIHVARLWRRALRRRSQKDGSTWARIEKLAHDFLPKPRILHPWPSERFAVKHPRWEPYAGKPHVRICAGACSNGRPYRDPKRGGEITGSPSPKLAYHLDPVDGGNPALRGFPAGLARSLSALARYYRHPVVGTALLRAETAVPGLRRDGIVCGAGGRPPDPCGRAANVGRAPWRAQRQGARR